jgi:CBS domain-containing protein
MNAVVRDVMTTQVATVRRDTSFKEIAARMHQDRISAFPVLNDEGKVVGIVSEADMLAKEALDGGQEGMPGMIEGMLRRREQAKAAGTTAADLMTSPAVTVTPDDSLKRAARLMHVRRVKRLPVVDAEGRLVGIISRADALAVSDREDAGPRHEITSDVIPGGPLLLNI